jgi:hypothetical protein
MIRQSRPELEALEARWCPTLSFGIHLDSLGNLVIQGTPTSVDPNYLLLTMTGPDTYQLQAFEDEDKTLLYFDAPGLEAQGNVSILLPNTNDTVCLALDGNTMPGDLFMDGGFGDDYLLQDQLDLGGEIAGSLRTQRVNTISFFDGITIGGNLSFNADGNAFAFNEVVLANTVIGGSLYYQSGLPAPFLSNNLSLSNVEVGGHIQANLGHATTNGFSLSGGTLIQGNVVYTGGRGFDNVLLDGVTIEGTAAFRLKGNINQLEFQQTTDPSTVLGNFLITGGNNNDRINNFEGLVGGNVLMALKNGQNNVNITGGTILGPQVSILTGNGADTVLFDGTAVGARLTAFLGSGNDEMTFGPAAALALGFIDGQFGADTFIGLQTVDFPFVLRNFP